MRERSVWCSQSFGLWMPGERHMVGTSGPVAVIIPGDQGRGSFTWVEGHGSSEPPNPDLFPATTLNTPPQPPVLLPRVRFLSSLLSKAPAEGRALSPLPPTRLVQFVVMCRSRPAKQQRAENHASEGSRFPRPLPPLSRSRWFVQPNPCLSGCLLPPPPHSHGSPAMPAPPPTSPLPPVDVA